jgi:hypothetical protein
MPGSSGPVFHSNRYSAAAACEHCGGIVRHESWCLTHNTVVSYAYRSILDPSSLTLEDELILHALGVSWKPAPCRGQCQSGGDKKLD